MSLTGLQSTCLQGVLKVLRQNAFLCLFQLLQQPESLGSQPLLPQQRPVKSSLTSLEACFRLLTFRPPSPVNIPSPLLESRTVTLVQGHLISNLASICNLHPLCNLTYSQVPGRRMGTSWGWRLWSVVKAILFPNFPSILENKELNAHYLFSLLRGFLETVVTILTICHLNKGRLTAPTAQHLSQRQCCSFGRQHISCSSRGTRPGGPLPPTSSYGVTKFPVVLHPHS